MNLIESQQHDSFIDPKNLLLLQAEIGNCDFIDVVAEDAALACSSTFVAADFFPREPLQENGNFRFVSRPDTGERRGDDEQIMSSLVLEEEKDSNNDSVTTATNRNRHNEQMAKSLQEPSTSNRKKRCSMRSETAGFRALLVDFIPGHWSVMVGRDRKSIAAVGNKRLQVTIGWYVERYSKSRDDKEEKGRIISEIETVVEEACGGKGAFIKYVDGQWHEVPKVLAREKIARHLREALHKTYPSSSIQKRARSLFPTTKFTANK